MNHNTLERVAQILRKMVGPLTFSKRLPQEFGGGKMIVAPSSDIKFLIPGFSRFSQDLFLVASRYVKQGQCVWDLGANLGVFTFAAAWKVGSAGKVYCLEADPFYAHQIHRTRTSLPDGYGKVTPLCAAVADRTGLLDLCVPFRGHSRNHLAEVSGVAPGETAAIKQVCAITGDFLVQSWPKPDFVKIDIEGAEHLFFRGATDLVKIIRPIFYVEVSEDNTEEISSLLRDNDYDLFSLSEDGSEQPIDKCSFNTLARPR